MLTVAFTLLVRLVLIVRVDIFSLSDPVQVTLQVLLQLLLLTQLLEVSASFGLFPLFGELSALGRSKRSIKHKNEYNFNAKSTLNTIFHTTTMETNESTLLQ